MRAHIITIGDEILIGQIIDTNTSFIAKELDKIGVEVKKTTSIPDEKEEILQALDFASKNADIVLVTGGLGPTKDDVTKYTFCEFFNDTLVENTEVLKNIEDLFKHHVKKPMLPANKAQALVPSKATVLMNKFGTAPGMWLKYKETVFISMPGVPFEMKALMTNEVIPKLQKEFNRPYILHKTLHTYGRGESEIAATIEDWENNLPKSIKLAYLPSLGKVRLRLSTKGNNLQELEAAVESEVVKLKDLIGDIIFGYEDDEPLEHIVAELLKRTGKTLAVAESFTGGQIATAFTAAPGASKFFKGGIVTYATASKIDILNIDSDLISQFSVVSAPVAKAMAQSAQKLFNADYTISTTGNAGPTKGDSDAEIGTVFISIATPEDTFTHEFHMGNHRERVVTKSVNKALELLQKEILKN